VLHPGARVNHFEEKAAFTPEWDLYSVATPAVAAADAIAKSDVIDLTARMRPMERWTGTPPAWRLGLHFVLGIPCWECTNHPATAEATGLEVDKLDRRFVKKYFDTYLDSYKETVGADLMGQARHPLCRQR